MRSPSYRPEVRPRQRVSGRLILAICAALALVWAAFIVYEGGVFLRLGPIVLSSRRATTAFSVAALFAAAAIAASLRRGRQAALEDWATAKATLQRAWVLAKRLAPWAPLALLLVASGVSFARWATPRPLWLDEESTLLYVRDHPLLQLPGEMWVGQSAPLGWMAIERVLLVAVGDGDRAMRALPVALSLAMCGVAVWIGRRWLNAAGAFVFVGFCAFGQWLVHSRFEAKPYSGDACASLLLIAVAAWALEANQAQVRERRMAIWWIVAATTLWFANGAFLTAPSVALILFGYTWRNDGARAAFRTTAWASVWLASFGLCFWLSLRYTVGSTYLKWYWSTINSFPPWDEHLSGFGLWLHSKLDEVAANPGGTVLWGTFWLSALAGLLVSRRGTLALLAAGPPITALAASIAHVVPLHDRVSLWMIPAVFLALGLLADRAAEWWRMGAEHRDWKRIAVAVAAFAPIAYLAADAYPRRDFDAPLAGGRPLNHGLDDERAVTWLLAQREAGDDVMTTRLTWSTIWWYGRIPLTDGSPATEGLLPDGGIQFEAAFDDSGVSCRHENSLVNRLRDRRRVLVYIGFPDQPTAFAEVLIEELRSLGSIVNEQIFGEGIALVFRPQVPAVLPEGQRCIRVNPFSRW